MSKMKRLEKHEGFGNVKMVEADIPTPAADEVLGKVKRSLISRGSELFMRYVKEGPVEHDIMGYSDAGVIIEAGSEVDNLKPGDRAMLVRPHAEYVTASVKGDAPRAVPIPDELSFERAVFMPLTTSAILWMDTTPIIEGDIVVILGQGIVGQLCAQAVRKRKPGRVITVDAQEIRCGISRELGCDESINCSKVDSVERVRELTGGKGADVVIECVGGNAGLKSFEQAQRMLKNDGVIHLIALYHGAPLELDASRFMNKMLIAGIRVSEPRLNYFHKAAQALVDETVRVEPLITHRMPGLKADEAYHLLYNNPDEALGVVLEWDD
ncbi:MAG: zinc-binding alcohol dehydrogenase [Planctomycetota bacterium]|nr:zinc-binding alcohol dehydrogenase [Planctomycetota bacterium]